MPPQAPPLPSSFPAPSFKGRPWLPQHDRPGRPRSPQASPLPSPSSPPSFRRWEQHPQGLGLGQLSSRPATAAWRKRERSSSPQSPRVPSSPSPQPSFRQWEWLPRNVNSGASSENWNSTAREKQTWSSSPQQPQARHLPYCSSPLSIRRWEQPQHVGLQTPSDIHTSAAGIKRSFPGSAVPLNRK